MNTIIDIVNKSKHPIDSDIAMIKLKKILY